MKRSDHFNFLEKVDVLPKQAFIFHRATCVEYKEMWEKQLTYAIDNPLIIDSYKFWLKAINDVDRAMAIRFKM